MNLSSKIEDYTSWYVKEVEQLPEGRDLPFEIDPDKRDWEYDGDGRRVPKTP